MNPSRVADSLKKGAQIMGAVERKKGSKGQGSGRLGERVRVEVGADCTDIVSGEQGAHVVGVQWLADVRFVADVVCCGMTGQAGDRGELDGPGAEGGGGGSASGMGMGMRWVMTSVDFHERSGFGLAGGQGLDFEKKRGPVRLALREGGIW